MGFFGVVWCILHGHALCYWMWFLVTFLVIFNATLSRFCGFLVLFWFFANSLLIVIFFLVLFNVYALFCLVFGRWLLLL